MVGSTVVVATEHNKLYGLDLATGQTQWGPTSAGTAVPLSVIHNLGAPCGNIDPLGITSNLAVNGNTVFAVAEREQNPPGNTNPEHVLVGVDATTGNITVGPTNINPSGMNVPAQQQRVASRPSRRERERLRRLRRLGRRLRHLPRVGRRGEAGRLGDRRVVRGRHRDSEQLRGRDLGAGGLAVDGSGNVYAATGNSFNPPG